MSKLKKTIIVLVVVIGALCAWYAYHEYNRPVASLTNTTEDLTTDAASILSSYQNDEEKANQAYLDKVIVVTGKITKIDSDDGISIYLDSGDPLSQVICKLNKSHDPVSEKVGDQIKIKGVCTGYLMDVLLVNGSIMK